MGNRLASLTVLVLVCFQCTFAIDLNPLDVLFPHRIPEREVGKKMGEVLGVNPALVDQITNPEKYIIERGPAALFRVAETELTHIKGLYSSIKAGRIDSAFLHNINHELTLALNPDVIQAATPLMMLAQNLALGKDHFMEEPVYIDVSRGKFWGDPVYYVNGMSTSQEKAYQEAYQLSYQLARPVRLIYNGTHGGFVDLGESVLDRFGGLLALPDSHAINSTSRQLAHLFYHSEKPVSIVSHSQGCILVRNGLQIAETYKPVRQQVAWVATGMPLHRGEIYPEPGRFTVINNPEDTVVGQLISFNYDPKMLEKPFAKDAHDFSESYVKKISKSMVFGFGHTADLSKEELESKWQGAWRFKTFCSIAFRADGIYVTNEKGHTVIADLVDSDTIKIRPNYWGGISGDLVGNSIRWSNGTVWERVSTEK